MSKRLWTYATLGTTLMVSTAAIATPEQDLNRAYRDFQYARYLQARDGARDYLRANGPRFSAAFIIAASECMLHPHQAANAAPFRRLNVDYHVSAAKNQEINTWIRQCTSPPPPPPEAGVSVQGLTLSPPTSTGRPANDEPKPKTPSPVAAGGMIGPPPGPPLPTALAADRCVQGYVWREAFVGDHVCVVPLRRAQAARDNLFAASRRDPQGAYGPESCIQGYVWREARPGDVVCVTPTRRQQAAEDNAQARSRRMR